MFLLSSFFFFYFGGVGIYIVFLPKILQTLSYTPYQIGIIFSIVPLMKFLTPFLFLKFFSLDKKVYTISLFISLASVIMFFLTIKSYYLLIVNIAIFGMSNALIMPYIDSIALEKMKKRYGKSRLWGSLGFMVVSLVLARYLTNYKVGLYFYFFIVLAITIIGFIISKNSKNYNLKQDNMSDKSFSLTKNWQFWTNLFLVQASFGFFYNFFTIYETAHGISLKEVSYLWSLSIICEVIMFSLQSKILHLNLLHIIKFSILVTILRWFLLYLFPSLISVSYLTQSFHAISFALFHTATITYLHKLYSQKKLSMQFYHGISYGLGGFTGSIIAGYFYGEYLFLIASLIAILGFFVLFLNSKEIGRFENSNLPV